MSEYNNQRGNADQNHSAIFSHLLDLLQSKRQEIIVGRDIEKKNPCWWECQLFSFYGYGNPLQFLPEEFHGQRSLAGYSLWGGEESDMTE